jgi:hypothetical protein
MKQFYMEHFTDLKLTEVYQVVKTLYAEQLLDLWDHPVLIPEMLSLEAERKSRDKIFVRKPNRRGAHDDISDAFSRAVWLCFQNRHGKSSNIAMGRGGEGLVGPTRHDGATSTPAGFALQRMKMHGEHPRLQLGRRRRLTGMSVR